MATLKGPKSQRQIVVDLIAPRDYDSVTTYEEIAAALGMHPVEHKGLIRSVVQSARDALAKDHHRTLEAVRSVGYRIIRPEEHVKVAGELQRKAGRTVALARTTVESVDLTELSEEGRKIAMAAAAALGYQAQMIRRMDLRQAGIEKVLEAVTEKVDETVAATEDHQERLSTLEQRIAAMEAKAQS